MSAPRFTAFWQRATFPNIWADTRRVIMAIFQPLTQHKAGNWNWILLLLNLNIHFFHVTFDFPAYRPSLCEKSPSMKTISHPFLTSFSISEWTSHISAFLWLLILNDTRTAWPAPPWAGLCQILEEMLFMWRCKKNEMKRHFKFNFPTHKRKYI